MELQRPPAWLLPPASSFEVAVIGASTGGLRAARLILAALSSNFPGSVLIAHHRGEVPIGLSGYASMFQFPTELPVWEAVNGERMRPGIVYLAPWGRHLELDSDGKFYTGRDAMHGGVRPSADLLFHSVATYYGDRAVAVVLSGQGRDGCDGVRAVRERGGFVIAQDESSCDHFDMPCSAIETRRVDLVLPIHHIGFALNTLFGTEPR